jgi:hypothetical protein
LLFILESSLIKKKKHWENLALLSLYMVPGAEGGDDEEEVAEDCHHNGDHVQGDPPPPVVLTQDVANIRDHLHMEPSII